MVRVMIPLLLFLCSSCQNSDRDISNLLKHRWSASLDECDKNYLTFDNEQVLLFKQNIPVKFASLVSINSNNLHADVLDLIITRPDILKPHEKISEGIGTPLPLLLSLHVTSTHLTILRLGEKSAGIIPPLVSSSTPLYRT